MTISPTSGPVGITPMTETVTLTTHGAIAIGDVVAVSPTVNSDGQFYLTQAPLSGNAHIDDNEFGVFAVALEVIASGANGRFALAGILDVSADGTDAITVGESLEVDASTMNVNAGTTPGYKVVGFAIEALASGTGLIKVMFDGYNGFGTVHA
mgnify:CR=1 FL=1